MAPRHTCGWSCRKSCRSSATLAWPSRALLVLGRVRTDGGTVMW